MKLKDVSFLIRVYSVLMSNDKVRSPLTDMINIFLTLHEIVFRIKYIKKISINEIKQIIMSEIRVITKLPNSEQSYKGKVKTHNYINRQNQSTTGKL